MTYLDDLRHPWPPPAADDTLGLLGSLERQRATFAWKSGGLDEAGMRATVGASAITLGSLVKHLALIEDDYFSHRMNGRSPGPPWDSVDWEAEPRWDWHSAAADSSEELMALWEAAVTRSRVTTQEMLRRGGFDQPNGGGLSEDGVVANVRRLLLDLIEEYARHVGHADLIRESIDGLVGEDPPPGTGFAADRMGRD
jgi:Protein of unknown function (DUF664)